MAKFKIVYVPDISKKKCIFTNINMKKLSAPITITREKPLEEEVVFNARKRSEIVEYETEEYKKLKTKESCPLLIEDVDSLTFTGKLQDVGSNSSSYFTFIRDGDTIYMTPIKKWYRFVQKFGLKEVQNEDEITKFVPDKGRNDDSNDSDREEIDFEDCFEDDDGEDYNFEIQKQKKLSKEGKKLRHLVENLEKGENPEDEEVSEPEIIEKNEEPKKSQEVKVLTNDKIKECFTAPLLSVKELIRKLKTNFSLDNEEKALLKKFINDFCAFEVDKATGEKQLKLKK